MLSCHHRLLFAVAFCRGLGDGRRHHSNVRCGSFVAGQVMTSLNIEDFLGTPHEHVTSTPSLHAAGVKVCFKDIDYYVSTVGTLFVRVWYVFKSLHQVFESLEVLLL